MTKTKKVLVTLLATVMCFAFTPAMAFAEDEVAPAEGVASIEEVAATEEAAPVEGDASTQAINTWERLAGPNRIATMKAIVDEGWPGTASAVVVATSDNYPDALAASGFAGLLDAPIILTNPYDLSDEARELIERLAPSRIFIVGGEGAISGYVEDQLIGIEMSNGEYPDDVIRYGGNDRYETANLLFEESVLSLGLGSEWGDLCVLVSGDSYADALSIAPWAYAGRYPIFLSNPHTGVDAETKRVINNAWNDLEMVILIGGKNAVPDFVIGELGLKYGEYKRIAGEDRYQTSAAVAAWGADPLPSGPNTLNFENIFFATGENFPDALAGGALAGLRGHPMLLVDDTEAGHYGIEAIVEPKLYPLYGGYFLGGIEVLSEALAERIEWAAS